MSLSTASVKTAVSALNLFGNGLESLGVDAPQLASDALRRAAQRRTRLSDFGDWQIDEPLERLIESYKSDAKLTMLGRITARELLVSLLENLLHLEHERQANPQIAEEPIERPVFIIGLPRTGTTLLHGLMTEDPTSRVPLTWEVMFSAGYANDDRATARVRKKTATRLNWANRLAPEFKRIHPIAPDLAQECIAITANVFMSIQFHTTHDVSGYQDWFEGASQRLGYAFHHRLLQHLQTRRRLSRWVLKAPGHLFALDALLDEYPDAKIIQTHRDPLRVIASMASHATVLRRAFSDDADPKAIGRDWAARWADALYRSIEIRERYPASRFLDIYYEDIVRAPFSTLEKIYDFIGAPFSADARSRMQAFLEANPKNKHGKHVYSLGEFGLSDREEIERYAEYCDRFDIEVQRTT